MSSLSRSGRFDDSPAAGVQSDPAGAGVSRAEPHLATVQPPLCRQRERACPRMGRHGETGDGSGQRAGNEAFWHCSLCVTVRDCLCVGGDK